MRGKKPQSDRVYRIGEAARALNLQTSVLRFWEGEFPMLHPVRTPRGQRLYTEQDMTTLRAIRSLLHEQGMTIEGARRVLSQGSASPAAKAARKAIPHTAADDVLRDVARELRELRALLSARASAEEHA